jgi:hypothetical protein
MAFMTKESHASKIGFAALELSELVSFNDRLVKLVDAGVPIRFPGAPSSLVEWLKGISDRVSARVGSGESTATALAAVLGSNGAYQEALSAWLNSRSSPSIVPSSDSQLSEHDLRVLEPWVQAGLNGDREIDRSALFAFWLWIIAVMASVSMVLSVWRIFPKLEQFYDNSGYKLGISYRGCQWVYDRLGIISFLLAVLLVAVPWCWRYWFQRVAKHRAFTAKLRYGFFAAYLVFGGAIVLGVGWLVIGPMAELLVQVGEPQP